MAINHFDAKPLSQQEMLAHVGSLITQIWELTNQNKQLVDRVNELEAALPKEEVAEEGK